MALKTFEFKVKYIIRATDEETARDKIYSKIKNYKAQVDSVKEID